ncbi:MAG: DUF1330 domain-containing protein [Pseudorhodoplanes sp.]
MAKGYWVMFAEVTDPGGYKEYLAANKAPLAKYGARFLTRAGKMEPKEGKPKPRVVVVEFPSYEAALECYQSSEYKAAAKLREGRALADLAIVEGYDGPQPPAS